MKTLKAIWHSAGRLGTAAGAVLACSPALALKDLEGGPGINQLDLPVTVTEIGRDQI